MTGIVLLLSLFLAESPRIIIDSQKYHELIKPYENCVRGNRLSRYLVLMRKCEGPVTKDLQECAREAWADSDSDTPADAEDACDHLKPSLDQLLDNVAMKTTGI